ncbi:MAG: hypothetical protein II544_03605 [Spirochaetales bacterium]|nr:hypothetical protein [Spirochaetales bacterium]
MIDLSGINRFYELKWFDGTSVWLKKPTEAMLRKLIALDEADGLDALEGLQKMVIELVKDNEEGRKFPKEELDELDAVLCSMIFKDYMEYTTKRLGE